jgi:hypothetical protein
MVRPTTVARHSITRQPISAEPAGFPFRGDGHDGRVTWLFVLLLWTACATVAAPVVGRVLAHAARAAAGREVAPRAPLPLG